MNRVKIYANQRRTIVKDFKRFWNPCFSTWRWKKKEIGRPFFSANLLGIYGFALIDIADILFRNKRFMLDEMFQWPFFCNMETKIVLFFKVFHFPTVKANFEMFLWNILSSKYKKKSEECRYSVVYHRTSTPNIYRSFILLLFFLNFFWLELQS